MVLGAEGKEAVMISRCGGARDGKEVVAEEASVEVGAGGVCGCPASAAPAASLEAALGGWELLTGVLLGACGG
jgi:hypothetical protein